MMRNLIKYQKQLMLAEMCFLFVFILDALTPLKVAGGIGILYMVVVLISMYESKKAILYTALFATLLIIIKYICFSIYLHPSQQSGIPFNRIISIIGLWIAVIVALKSKQFDELLLTQKSEYTKTIKEIIYINSHKVRKPVTNIVKLVELMEDNNLSDNQARELMVYLRQSAQELEVATKEMTDTISRKRYNRRLLLPSSV